MQGSSGSLGSSPLRRQASFSMGRWSAGACLPFRFSILWPAAWVACFDKSPSSKSAEVRRIWMVHDESLLFWLVMFLRLGVFGHFRLRSIWFVLLSMLVPLFLRLISGCDVVLPSLGMCLLVALCLVSLVLGMISLFTCSRMLLFLGLSCFGAGLAVLSVLDGISRHGLALSSSSELGAAGPCGPLSSADLSIFPSVGFPIFGDCVRVQNVATVFFFSTKLLFIVEMSLSVVGVLGCWKMTRFILTVDLVLTWWLLRPFCVVILVSLLTGVGFSPILSVLTSSFRRAWLPFF